MSQVICLGEILFDLLADQLGRELTEVASWTPYPGGAPANVACGLVKLGTSAAFIGCLGKDKEGTELRQLLVNIGVNIEGVQEHPTAPTRKVYVTRSLTGERHFAGFGDVKTTEFADTHLKADLLPDSLFFQGKYLVIGTLGLAYRESHQGIMKALEMAKQHKIKIFVDINWRPVFWLDYQDPKLIINPILELADLVKCTNDEAQWLFKTEDPAKIQEQYPHLLGILMTAGEKGCHYRIGEAQGHQPIFKVNSQDTTGAGDSFVAGFLHQAGQMGDRLFEEANLAQQAIHYASAVGALTTTRLGAIAAQPTATEVKAFLQ